MVASAIGSAGAWVSLPFLINLIVTMTTQTPSALPFWHREVWDGIEVALTNPDILSLLYFWQDLPVESDGLPSLSRMPLHQAEWDEPLHRFAPTVMVLESLGDGDFRYLHYGSEIRRHSMIDMAGCRVSDFGGVLAAYFLDCYRQVQARGRPLYTLHYSDRAATVFTWERLILPLHRPDGGIALVVYNQPLELRAHLLEAVLDASRDAILALRRVIAAQPNELDWMVLVANRPMIELGGALSNAVVGRCVNAGLPRWSELGLDALCLQVVNDKHQRETEISLDMPDPGGQRRWFQAYCGPLREGCLVRLTDITEAKLREQQLQVDAQEMARTNAELQQWAWRDGLTGLANRRALDTVLVRELARARRHADRVSLVLCDIDHFKAYNDLYGHLQGDDCIRKVALSLQQAASRPSDLVARFGGEEFVLVLPAVDAQGALQVVERIRQMLHEQAMPHGASDVCTCVTLSFGVAALPETGDVSDWLNLADQALYRAKRGGRNLVELYCDLDSERRA